MKKNTSKTNALLEKIVQKNDDYQLIKEKTKHLGVHKNDDSVQFIFWTPEVGEPDFDAFFLEVYSSKSNINFEKKLQNIDFEVFTFDLSVFEEYAFVAIDGIKMGDAQQVGDFYQLFWRNKKGETKKITDPLSYSIPFGAFSPAEVFDWQRIGKNRKDEFYLKNIGTTSAYPANILEIHVPTTTKGGTIADLGDFYKNISKKVDFGDVDSVEKCFLGYDAIELMPLQPLCEYETHQGFWQETQRIENKITVKLQKPDTQNWGYDILIAASSAINPNLLKTKRPHELVHFLEILHNFSENPIQVILDVVYGHADGQGALVLNKSMIAGDGMYGKTLNYNNLQARAIYLESLRRMANYGIDGFRIDASQDINSWNDDQKRIDYDAVFLQEINEIKAEIAGATYKPFIIFEDGRPWPERGWALKQTYREVTERLPDTIQWGPLTFADNNPHIFNFWQHKFFRIKEIGEYGERWLTGSSNHDSLRKGANQNPFEQPINVYFGEKLSEIYHKGYNAPATKLLESFLPGTPMDFAQANVGAPWLFMRNTDEQWGLKIVAEEANFVHWFVDENTFSDKNAFLKIKKLGYQDFAHFKNFMTDLPHIVKLTDYDWAKMIKAFNLQAPNRYPKVKSVAQLKAFAKAFMSDAHDFCNILNVQDFDKNVVDFLFDVRFFRKRNYWLSKNLCQKSDIKTIPIYGATVYQVTRFNPENGKYWVYYANMEGESITLQVPDYQNIIIKTPNAIIERNRLILGNSEGVVVEY